MARQPTRTRRTVLGTIAGLAMGTTAGIVSGSGDGAPSQDGPADAPASRTQPTAPTSNSGLPFETFVATVDRIVDGEHVVILLEEGGRTVDQLVVPRDRLPTVQERDRLVVLVRDGNLAAAWPLPDRLDPRLGE
ncbi:DUF3006 domain-containing protein [Natronosalvus halobius]|uniref:DUF3006 domain-containing protein n=1 Tax=Natronosalvus halobius TaxID=2953746 RepID=UPI00209C8CFD|nr:DUF3006 domain-containing protein [Natronosalvus halobius]USZ70274.1 DUF3006 domain-containing protein [Natronosalvus halobius]